MENFLISFKRFIKNKNTVTIIIVIVCLALLYWVYTSIIKRAVNPISIPVTTVEIQPRTEITKEMITTIEVPSIAVNESVIQSSSFIIGQYTNINCYIPEGSMLYKTQLVDKASLPDSAFDDVKEGEIPYQFAVNMETTYGNSIFPGSKIDIYMKATDASGKVMVGRLLADVEVLAVKDSSGNNVFESTSESRTPSYLVFGLQEEIYLMLKQIEYLGSYDIEVFPVPHGGQAVNEGETRVGIQYLVDYVNALTVDLTPYEESVTESTNTVTDTTTTTTTDTTTKAE